MATAELEARLDSLVDELLDRVRAGTSRHDRKIR
jgi:hypothetical protein